LRCFRGFLPLAGLAFGTARSQEAPAIDDWTDLAELGRIQVVAVSRRPVPLADAPAAVSVLAANDILRSGAPSIPEALRAVPGLMVGQIDANSWAISSRGFNSEYAGKMLVMIDGRSVYSPDLSLTYWDEQNAMLDDLDRIEVIRGPGSTHWGANAVNGVINIVGKSARETQGTLAYGSGGWPQEIATGARVGGQAGENTYYRVYGLYQQTGAYPLRATGEPGTDRWHFGQGGFRIDHALPDDAQWTGGRRLHTESEDDDQSARAPTPWDRYKAHPFATTSIETQVYYDNTMRTAPLREHPPHPRPGFQYSIAAGDRTTCSGGWRASRA
jgi:iron complex outermembrane receptor protein